jgi:hypothetical protein
MSEKETQKGMSQEELVWDKTLIWIWLFQLSRWGITLSGLRTASWLWTLDQGHPLPSVTPHSNRESNYVDAKSKFESVPRQAATSRKKKKSFFIPGRSLHSERIHLFVPWASSVIIVHPSGSWLWVETFVIIKVKESTSSRPQAYHRSTSS